MTTIAAIRSRPIVIPLERETAFSTRSLKDRHYALVEVVGDDGVVGTGFCYVGHAGSQLVADAVRLLLNRRAVGEDIHRVEGLWADLYQEVLLHGRAGLVMRALSALDIAIWDHNAKAAAMPLHKMLGSAVTDTVRAYASGGYYREGKSPEMLAEEAIRYVDEGFDAIKVKVGRDGDLHAEEARLAAVRTEIGPEPLLMLDANNAWTDVAEAYRFARMAEAYDPYWIEEPFSPDDINSHERLATLTAIPIATGELEAGRWRFKELVTRRAASIVQPDACVCGGVTEFRRIVALAESFGVSVSPHWFQDVHTHLVAATSLAGFVEVFPDFDVFNFGRLLAESLVVRQGRVEVPTSPGLGITFDADAVDRFAVAPWS